MTYGYRTSFTAAAQADREETIVDGRFSSSGDIALADGTATQGAIYFADDKNTGIYSPSNDSIAFTTAGSAALTIANNDATFEGDIKIESDMPRIWLTDTNSENDFSLYNGNGTFTIKDETTTALPIRIYSGSGGADSGNAGAIQIDGNLDATAGIDVTGLATFNTGTAGSFKIQGTSTGTNVNTGDAGTYLQLRNLSTNADTFTVLQGADGSGQGTSQIAFVNLVDGTNQGQMVFSTRPAGGSMTSALTLNSTQNATFAGTVTTTGTLNVNGATNNNGNIYARPNGTAVYAEFKGLNAAGDKSCGMMTWEGSAIFIDSSNNGSISLRANGTGDIDLQTNGSVRAKVTDDGICFNADTAAANALDDYEEGTFTATCANSVTLHSTNDRCSYTKIGRQVTVTGSIRVDSDNSDADLVITNLPFQSNSEPGAAEGTGTSTGDCRLYEHAVPSNTMGVHCLSAPGANTLTFQCDLTTGAASIALPAASNGYIAFSITYFCNL